MPKVNIEISPLTFAKIIDWSSSNTEREIGGYLIGLVSENKVTITDAIFATAQSNPTFVSFDNMIQFKIIKELEKKGSSETILGWFHTHPGMGCFLSGTDIATQKVYQALLPEAVAMVNDGNLFAQSRNQKDFKAHFYRVGKENKYNEVSFGVITDPNELLDLLTDFVQAEESVENIVTSTVQHMSMNVKDFIEVIAEDKLVAKKAFDNESTLIKKAIAQTRKDIESKHNTLEKQLKDDSLKLKKNSRIFSLVTIISLVFSLLSLAGIITLIILNYLP